MLYRLFKFHMKQKYCFYLDAQSYAWQEVKDSYLIVVVVSPKKTRNIAVLDSVPSISTGNRFDNYGMLIDSILIKHHLIANLESLLLIFNF